MRNSKKILSVFLALAMILSLMPMALAAESSYQDTEGHWAEAAIERWSGFGVIQGNNGQFNPNNSLTRGHMAAVLSRLLNLPDAPDAGFSDVKDGDWYAEYINKCAAAGIMLGSDGKANPNAPITRQQAIVMLGRALGIQPVENPDLSHFQDGTAISDYAKGYVAAMNEAGIVGGITSDTLGGGSDITRAQTVTILNRAIGTYANEAGATVAASSSGITLVAADNVTVTGTADSVLVSQGVSDGAVTLSSSSAGSVTVTAENATVYVSSESKADDVTLTTSAVGSTVVVEKGAQVGTVTTEAPKSTVSVSGTVETVTTTATAEKASVEVSKTATVGEIAASGEKTEIAVSGKVENVTVSDTATDTTVKANSGSTISNVDNAAEGTTVSGSGKVENVTTSGDNTTVSTPGTKVEADQGTTGTTAGNKDLAGGSSTTTPSGGTSSGSSGGGSSHSHSYTSSVTKQPTCTEAGVRTYTCSCGASYTEAIPATGVHTYVYTRNDDTHTGTCSVCGATTNAEAHVVGDDGKCSVCGLDGFVARIGTTGYMDLQDALNVGGEVVLVKDVTIDESKTTAADRLTITQPTTLHLNAKLIAPGSLEPTSNWAALYIAADTIIDANENGGIQCLDKENGECGPYAINIISGANVIINGGEYYGGGTAVQVQLGSLTINNGTFDGTAFGEPYGYNFLLNCVDEPYASGTAKIIVNGGAFCNYDPSAAKSESPIANFVPVGYDALPEVKATGEIWYSIVEGTVVSSESELTAALGTSVSTIYLANDIDLTDIIELERSITIIGNNHSKLNVAAGKDRVINIMNRTNDITLTMKNVNVVGPTSGSYTRGISAYNNSGSIKIVLDNCSVSCNYYALNIGSGNTNLTVSITNSTLSGWCAAQTWSAGTKATFENCTLVGNNDKGYNSEGWNDFATIVINEDTTDSELTFKNCRIEANQTTGNKQYLLSVRAGRAAVTLENCTFFANGTEISDGNLGNYLSIYQEAADLMLTIDKIVIPIK